MPAAVLKRNQDRRVRAGHPWIFSNEIASFEGAVEDGGIVDVLDARHAFVARGFVNRHSLIAVRVLTRKHEPISADLFRRRFDAAVAYRAQVAPNAQAARLVAGEADLLPGLFVDRYCDYLVVQSTTLGMDLRLTEIAEPLRAATEAKGALARCDQPARALEGLGPRVETLWGEVPEVVTVHDEGLDLEVRPRSGQKTGLYLDQRDNRARLARHLAGMTEPRVLDLFCYMGLWSFAALRAGAASARGVDSSAAALEAARETAERNGFAERALFVEADVFAELRTMERARERYDVIVVDPPPLVRSRAHLEAGLRAYRDLNVRALRLLAPGGLLVSCTCSHNVTREIFLGMLLDAQRHARRHCRLLEIGGQSLDHPVLLAAPETSYLTAVYLRVA
jgi:23S rRNA (cytosine1962-C5)-methyltransferase